MDSHLAVMLSNFGDASAAGQVMRQFVAPVFATLAILAGLACTFFLVNGGIAYMTSTGRPDKLEHAKKVIRNALLGLVLVKAIVGLFQNIIQTAAQPFLNALNYFTHATPLMAVNSSVFSLWLAIVGIADALFVLVVALLGFHVMSYATLGLEEIEFKHLLPQIGLTFLALNTSIFVVDAIISLSNGMIHALYAAFPGKH
jgi:hypothetical protein